MNAFITPSAISRRPVFLLMPGAPLPSLDQESGERLTGWRFGTGGNAADVSVGHGPGTPRNEGTAPDRSTPAPDSNLTEIDPTEEPAKEPSKPKDESRSDAGRP